MHIKTLWSLLKTADMISLFVIASLVAAYFLCFCIIVYKSIVLFNESRALRGLMNRVGTSWRLQDFIAVGSQQSEQTSISHRLIVDGLADISHATAQSKAKHGFETLSTQDLQRLQQCIDQRIDASLKEMQFGLPVLSTSAAAAPLAGLFGTIWGLIHAFVNIGRERSADLAVIAPGIAEALLTTLVGLIVAIPALVFYHYFAQKVHSLEQQLVSLGERLVASAAYNMTGQSVTSTNVESPSVSATSTQSQ